MIYCLSCLTENTPDSETCVKCGAKLMVLSGNRHWDEPELPRLSMEDHFLERISNLEETVNTVLEHMSRLVENLDVLDRNLFVTRSGLSSLVDTLKETNLLREELLYQRWEATMIEQMEEADNRDRFTQMKDRFLALYRGQPSKQAAFESLIEEAEFLIFSDRFNESTEVLARALRLDKRNYELAFYLAEFHHKQGLNQEGLSYIDTALASKNDHVDSLLLRGLILYGERSFEESEKSLKRCLSVQPNNAKALMCLASIYVDDSRYEEAAPLLERVLKIDPQARAYYLMGVVSKERGKLHDAFEYLDQALELEPNHEDALLVLGMAYLERGWTRKAKAVFAQALELNPHKFDYGEDTPFDAQYEVEVREDMDAAGRKTLQFAKALMDEGKLNQALPHFRQLLKRYPSDPSLLAGYAVLCFSLRRYQEALKAARKILGEEIPEMLRIVAFTLLMESFRALGRYEEAVEVVHEMRGEYQSGYGRIIADYGLSLTLADIGRDLDQAEQIAKDALSVCPPEFRHKLLDALGWVYFRQGRFEDALELLKTALSMKEDLNHLYHYGMVLLSLNLQEEAFKIFERTVQLRNRYNRLDDFLYTAMQEEMGPFSS